MKKEAYKLPSNPPLSDGMRVPDGYFKSVQERIAAALPVNEAAENPERTAEVVQPSMWRRIRPYVYMAAMFAGVWCMTKMFSLMKTGTDTPYSLEGNSVLTAALSNNDFVDDYVLGSMNDYDILNQLYDEGIEIY